MKHSLSRFFGLGDKEHPERDTEIEAEIAEHETLKEEIQELPVDTIMPNRFQPRTIFSEEKYKSWPQPFIPMALFNRLLLDQQKKKENMN